MNHKALSSLTQDTGANGFHIPDHPGAERLGPGPPSMMFLMTFFNNETNQKITPDPIRGTL